MADIANDIANAKLRIPKAYNGLRIYHACDCLLHIAVIVAMIVKVPNSTILICGYCSIILLFVGVTCIFGSLHMFEDVVTNVEDFHVSWFHKYTIVMHQVFIFAVIYYSTDRNFAQFLLNWIFLCDFLCEFRLYELSDHAFILRHEHGVTIDIRFCGNNQQHENAPAPVVRNNEWIMRINEAPVVQGG